MKKERKNEEAVYDRIMQNRKFMLEGGVDFFYLLQIFWKYSTYDIIFIWQNSKYHPTNYEMTNSIFSTLRLIS